MKFTSKLSRKIGIVSTIAILLVTAVTGVGLAQADSESDLRLTIPVDTVKRESGELARESTPEILIGRECEVYAEAKNQGSVHPGNDLVVTSGNDKVTLEDVERESGVSTEAEGTLTLGSNVVVALELGKDDIFSAGFDIVIDCEKPQPKFACTDLSVSATKIEGTTEVEFTVEETYTNTEVEGYLWNFGDGTETATEENSVTHVYEQAGEYTASVRVKTVDGTTDATPDCQTDIVVTDEELPEVLASTGVGSSLLTLVGSGALGIGLRGWIVTRRKLISGLLAN